MALIVLLGVSLVTCLSTQAAGKEVKPYMSLDSTQLLNSSISFGSSIGGVPNDKYTITSVKSSNKKVIAVDKEQSDQKVFFLKGLSAGKSKIEVKVKVGSKTYTLKKTVEIVDDKPFSYIKYNGKNCYKGNEYKNPYLKQQSGKVFEWKVKKGYKVISATLYNGNGKTSKITSGKKLYFKGDGYPEVMFFIKTPDGKYIYYSVSWFSKNYK